MGKLLFIPSVFLTDPRAAAGTELLQAASQKTTDKLGLISSFKTRNEILARYSKSLEGGWIHINASGGSATTHIHHLVRIKNEADSSW